MASIDIIKYIASGQNMKAQDEINSVLSQKALEAVTNLKADVASTFFGTPVQEEGVEIDEDTLIEGKKLIHKHEPEGSIHTAKVYYNSDDKEYQTHFYKNGKHMGEGPVNYTDNKEDAIGTAKAGVDHMNKNLKEGVSYSAKKAVKGKDIGKKGKNFSKIAKEAGDKYGSSEAGKRVAGAILKKLRKENVNNDTEE